MTLERRAAGIASQYRWIRIVRNSRSVRGENLRHDVGSGASRALAIPLPHADSHVAAGMENACREAGAEGGVDSCT